MIKLSLNRIIRVVGLFLGILLCFTPEAALLVDNEREKEIQAEVWGGQNPDFNRTEIPEKWVGQPGIIIARDRKFSYHKVLMSSSLKYVSFSHVRIKLNGQKALDNLSQFTIPKNGQIQNVNFEFYAGFKIIKPTGEEIIITQKDGSIEKQEIKGKSITMLKIAVPNLEPGDILDYYIVEDRIINLYGNKYFSFDPAILVLNDEYPIIKQRFVFDVMRKCYVNIKTMNGTPEIKHLEDIKYNQNSYVIEDEDRESVEGLRWFYKYRSLPNIKFKATYAANESITGSFQGNQGEIKTNVSKSEVSTFVKSYIQSSYQYADKTVIKHMSKYYKKEKNKDTLARAAFYVFRNDRYIKRAEKNTLNENDYSGPSSIRGLTSLIKYYRVAKIPVEIIVGVPRFISSIEDIILENEMTFMLKVLSPTPFYISNVSTNTIIDEIDPELQGSDVYTTKIDFANFIWIMSDSKIPVVPSEENLTSTNYTVSITGIAEGNVMVNVEKSVRGAEKDMYQKRLMDVYDFIDSENEIVETKTFFEDLKGNDLKNYIQKKEDYFSHRDHDKNSALMNFVNSDFSLEVDTVSNLKIIQPGRHHSKPEFVYSYDV
ncbi:MAG: DUF3857 domain-containing protein, partial [Cyclobacteriaceae bacterium]|nr:DUF3857 domain-containing protein [Cyclobacteriaceae bacterium]